MAAIGFAAPWILRRATCALALARSHHRLGINKNNIIIKLSHYKVLRSFTLTHPLTSSGAHCGFAVLCYSLLV